MKLFQSVQRSFALVGITSGQSNGPKQFNWKISIAICSYSAQAIAFNVYLFHIATTFWEYTDNIFINSAASAVVTGFTIVAFNKPKFFGFIDSCETFVVKSKQKKT